MDSEAEVWVTYSMQAMQHQKPEENIYEEILRRRYAGTDHRIFMRQYIT